MARTFIRRGFRRRVRRNWQWARMTSADTAVITTPGHYSEDLLSTFKSEFGFSVNFPDITIWRIRLRISVGVHWIASPVNFEQAGYILGVFVDDPNFTIQGVETHPYMEKFMFYGATYYTEAIMAGEALPVGGATNFLTKEYDIKARRRLGNIEDSLIMQVGTTGSAVADLHGLSWSSSVLLSLGRR